MAEKIRIVLPIYDGVTQLDFTGPHQFFSRMPNSEAVVASVRGEPVDASGLVFTGLADLSGIESCHVLCVPGGAGCVNVLEDEAFLSSIRRLARSARYVTSVCTGSIILGAAGLLEGKRAACHWAWRDMLPAFGAIPEAGRVVRDGNLITAGGAGCCKSLAAFNQHVKYRLVESCRCEALGECWPARQCRSVAAERKSA